MDAKEFVTGGTPGFAHRKIPVGAVVRATRDNKLLTVERCNGFVLTGYWNGIVSRAGAIDLRLEDALIVSLPNQGEP